MAEPAEMASRPGYRTTEFWITLIVTVAGVLASLNLPEENVVAKVTAVILSVGAAIGYTWSRGIIKREALREAPTEEAPTEEE